MCLMKYQAGEKTSEEMKATSQFRLPYVYVTDFKASPRRRILPHSIFAFVFLPAQRSFKRVKLSRYGPGQSLRIPGV